MKELIQIRKEGDKQLVSARDLHEFLEVNDHFTQWFQRMSEYGFNEGADYEAINIFVQHDNGIGGTNKKEFALTLDAAKEIAMIQRTEKGKMARQYFIECEKKLRGEIQLPRTYAEALLEAGRLALEVEQQQAQIESMKPKAEFFDAVTDSKDAVDIGNVAKILDLGIGRNQMFEFLRSRNILMRNNIPYQRYIDSGYFRIIEQKFQKADGSTHINIKTLVFQKGIDYILKICKQKV